MGQTSPQNTHFLCMLGALVGIQMGSLTPPMGLGVFPPLVVLNGNFCLPFQWLVATICCLYSMWLDNKPSLPKRKFVSTLFIQLTEAPRVEKVKVVLSTSHSCQKVQSLSHGINLYSNKIKIYSSWGLA